MYLSSMALLLLQMPSQRVTRTPSFIPSVYPYEITIMLSTETPRATLKLPQYHAVEELKSGLDLDVVCLGRTKSILDPVMLGSRATSSKGQNDDTDIMGSKESDSVCSDVV